jgi:hypothetical protein
MPTNRRYRRHRKAVEDLSQYLVPNVLNFLASDGLIAANDPLVDMFWFDDTDVR